MHTIKITLLMLVLLAVGKSENQNLTASFGSSIGISENLYNSVLIGEQSYVNSYGSLAFLISESFRVASSFSINEVLTNSDFTSSRLSLALQYRHIKHNTLKIYFGLNGWIENYSELLSYYNNTNLSAYVELKKYFSSPSSATLGYYIKLRENAELSELSYTEHQFSLQANRSFNSGTTINIEGRLGLQDFWPVQQKDTFRRHQQSGNSTLTDLNSNSILYLNTRISQSLGKYFGFTLWGELQTIIDDKTSSITIIDGLSNPFIDDYRWQGYATSTRLTYMSKRYIKIMLTGTIRIKSFIDVPIYQYDFTNNQYVIVDDEIAFSATNREDRKSIINLNIIKDWYVKTLPRWDGFFTSISIDWIKNKSNDPIFDVRNSAVNLSIGFNL